MRVTDWYEANTPKSEWIEMVLEDDDELIDLKYQLDVEKEKVKNLDKQKLNKEDEIKKLELRL